jgi:hypothetical protein
MSQPLTLKQLTQPNFVTVNKQDEALVNETGKTIHELIAEAVQHERLKMLNGEDSKQYVKLLTTVFGKFAVGAPIHTITEDKTQPLTREDIKARIDNYMTRMALGQKPKVDTESE